MASIFFHDCGASIVGGLIKKFAYVGDCMDKIINSNCKKCPDFLKEKCDGGDSKCMCRFCPRNLEACLTVKWCRESESPIIIEN